MYPAFACAAVTAFAPPVSNPWSVPAVCIFEISVSATNDDPDTLLTNKLPKVVFKFDQVNFFFPKAVGVVAESSITNTSASTGVALSVIADISAAVA